MKTTFQRQGRGNGDCRFGGGGDVRGMFLRGRGGIGDILADDDDDHDNNGYGSGEILLFKPGKAVGTECHRRERVHFQTVVYVFVVPGLIPKVPEQGEG